jgi:hypothetical protein
LLQGFTDVPLGPDDEEVERRDAEMDSRGVAPISHAEFLAQVERRASRRRWGRPVTLAHISNQKRCGIDEWNKPVVATSAIVASQEIEWPPCHTCTFGRKK